MQRMGDLILTFPLMLWLARVFPGREILVVAEEAFFRPLMPLSPKVTYVPWAAADALSGKDFHLVVNLSLRDRAARLAAQLRAEDKVGPLLLEHGGRYVRGAWQLYRASLVANNRHNRFHWADLNALDVTPLSRI
ncbi:MAG: glycosyltransferase family 9 protein, partial [Desulfovibrionaceae bacterium]|nr:glycosyltransferase family 9 protein [Desulfovibrionaceae bacterium]